METRSTAGTNFQVIATGEVPPLVAMPTVRECFLFPLSTPEARRDLVVGALLLVTTLPGWIWNLGHRLEVVYRIFHHEPPYYRGFRPWGFTFARGLRAFFAIACYLTPATLLGLGAWVARDHAAVSTGLSLLALVAFALGIFSLPGGMTYNAAFRDLRYLYRPDQAFRRALEGGPAYRQAWGIALLAMGISTLGLLGAGVGFLFTSVWAWMVVGFAFSRALALSNAPQATQQ